MKKFILALGVLLLIPTALYAQATGASRLIWDQPNATLTEAQAYTYKYYPDGSSTGITLTGVTCASAGTPIVITCQVNYPAFTPGAHNLRLTATNAAGESSFSATFNFIFVIVPSAPSNIRTGSPVTPASPVKK